MDDEKNLFRLTLPQENVTSHIFRRGMEIGRLTGFRSKLGKEQGPGEGQELFSSELPRTEEKKEPFCSGDA